MDELHDWSAYLIKVEKHIQVINDKLLHKEYGGLEGHFLIIEENLKKTLQWVRENREQ